MRIESVLRRLAERSDDPGALRSAARDFGDELPRRRMDVLRQFRAGVAAVRRGKTGWLAGYLEALTDVGASYEAALAEEQDEDAAEQFARRPHYVGILGALRDAGTLSQVDLGRRLGKSEGVISRHLSELRDAGLVEIAQVEKADGRAKLNRLTLRGERTVDRIRQRDLALPASETALLDYAVSFVAGVLFEGLESAEILKKETREAFERRSLDPKLVASTLARIAQKQGLLKTVSGPELEPADLGTPALVELALRSALHRDAVPFFWHELKEQAPVTRTCCLVRPSAATEGLWKEFLLRSETSERGWVGQGSRTLSRADLSGDAISLPVPAGDFVLLYDSAPLFQKEMQDLELLRSLGARAKPAIVLTDHLDPSPNDSVAKRLALGPAFERFEREHAAA